MKSALSTLAVIVGLVTNAIAASDGNEPLHSLNQADAIRLRYFNPEVSYRTIFAVGDVNSDVDYDISLNCHGSCAKSLVSIPSLLASARKSVAPCVGPPYARLDMLAGKASIATLYFDFTGSCVSINHVAYRLSQSAILKLHRQPLDRW
jgi:hypothetical protein